MLEHKDIKGTIEFDKETKMIFGKLVGVNGLVMYEADNAAEFEKNFISAVDDYIKMCEENDLSVKKEYKGVFNVRTTSLLHEKLILIAEERKLKLNSIVNEAFEEYVGKMYIGNTSKYSLVIPTISPAYTSRNFDLIKENFISFKTPDLIKVKKEAIHKFRRDKNIN